MRAPRSVSRAVVAISLFNATLIMAAAGDWLAGSYTWTGLVFSVAAYGAAMLIPVWLARRSDAARYVFLAFVTAVYLNWLRGIGPFPPFTTVALIVQIPVVVLLINWLFITPGTPEWFVGARARDGQEPVEARKDTDPD